MKNLFAFLLFLFINSALAQQVIKVGANEGTSRYQPVIVAIYKEIGLVAEFVALPSERSLKSVESGEIDADLGRVVGSSAGYQNMLETKESLIELQLLAVVSKDFKGGELSPASMKALKVGFARGTKIAEGFAKAAGIEPAIANTPQQVLQMLVAKRIDVALFPSSVPVTTFPEFGTTLMVQSKPLYVAKSVHIFNTKWASYAPKFDATVKAMKADGRWAKLTAAL